MGPGRQWKRSNLFLVRLWVGVGGDGEVGWRGHVQRAASGEIHRFDDLPELADLLRAMMDGFPGDGVRLASEPDPAPK